MITVSNSFSFNLKPPNISFNFDFNPHLIPYPTTKPTLIGKFLSKDIWVWERGQVYTSLSLRFRNLVSILPYQANCLLLLALQEYAWPNINLNGRRDCTRPSVRPKASIYRWDFSSNRMRPDVRMMQFCKKRKVRGSQQFLWGWDQSRVW